MASHAKRKLKTQEPFDTPELVARALNEPDTERAWVFVRHLHRRGTREVLNAARTLCNSADPRKRLLGVDILGQLGVPERTFPRQCGDVLLQLLMAEQDVSVLHAIGVACGHLNERRAIRPLAKFARHPDSYVRAGVVAGLIGYEHPVAIKTILRLMDDPQPDIREWATFGIAALIDTDTRSIRKALCRRALDLEPGVRQEAVAGLARRQDEVAAPILLHELERPPVSLLILEAAETLGNPALYEPLCSLRKHPPDDTLFAERLECAIAACAEPKKRT